MGALPDGLREMCRRAEGDRRKSISPIGPIKPILDSSIHKPTDFRTRFAWRAGYLLAAFGLFMADQATKAWAVRVLRFGDERVVIRGFLQFIYTENPGIAFGQLQEGGAFGRWFFVVLAVLAAIAVFYYFIKTP